MTNRETALVVHMHPLASYCWKVLLALYEVRIPFEVRQINGSPKSDEAFVRLWPIAKMPVLQDGDVIVPETSIIIDYLQARHPGEMNLIPADSDEAREVRLWDRFFDL